MAIQTAIQNPRVKAIQAHGQNEVAQFCFGLHQAFGNWKSKNNFEMPTKSDPQLWVTFLPEFGAPSWVLWRGSLLWVTKCFVVWVTFLGPSGCVCVVPTQKNL